MVTAPPWLPGRDGAIDILRGALADLAMGRGSRVVVTGEAGIGKSRLASWTTDEVRGMGGRVFIGGGHPFNRIRPFGALAEALDVRRGSADPRRVAIAEVLVAGAGVRSGEGPVRDVRFRIVDDLVDLVERHLFEEPVLLVVEDLHWADPSTLSALRSISRQHAEESLLLLVTTRPAPQSADLTRLVDDLRSAGASCIDLQPLTSGEAEAVAAQQLGRPPGPALLAALDKAGGNPLWIVELTRALDQADDRTGEAVPAVELPASLSSMVVRRLVDLPPDTNAMLRVAAVVGDTASLHELAAAARRSTVEVAAALEPAIRAGLLDERGERIAFRHQLVQEAIYQEMPRTTRQAMHREAASAFTEAGGDLLAVADHLVLGASRGDMEAVAWLRSAAREATGSDPSAAVRLLERAEALLPPRHDLADVVALEIVTALLRAGDAGRAADRARAVLDRRHRDDVDRALRLALVSALSLVNRPTQLIEEAASTLHALSDDDLVNRALVHAQASMGRSFSGDLLRGEAEARRAMALAEDAGDDPMRVWSRAALWLATSRQGRFNDALAVAEEGVAIAAGSSQPETQLRHPAFFCGMALIDVDRFDDARRSFETALVEYEQLGSTFTLPDTLLFAAMADYAAGEWTSARRGLDEGLRVAANLGQAVTTALGSGTLALIDLGSGDPAAAAKRLAMFGSAPLAAERPGFGMELVAYARAELARMNEDDPTAMETLVRLWRRDRATGHRYLHRLTDPALARLAVAAGQDELAREVLACATADAQLTPGVAAVQAAALRVRGLVERDVQAAVMSVGLLDGTPRVVEQAAAREDAATVLIDADRTTDAVALLDEALARYEAMGAWAWAGRAAASMRRLGVRRGARGPRRREVTGWDSLTDAELTVSRLVAEGMTNKEVAGRLHLSPHTINTHLRHVYAKLGVANRAGLAAEVARHPIRPGRQSVTDTSA